MKKILLLLFPAVLLMLSSCGGDDDGLTLDCTYFKARTGTTWKYETNQFGSISTQTTEATSTTEVDGIEVLVVTNTINGQAQESFVTCDGEKITQAAPSTQTAGGQTIENVLLSLDFGTPIGEQTLALSLSQDFSQSGISIFINNDYYGEVLETGLSKIVGGNTYNDVVKYSLTTFTETIIDGQSDGGFESAKTFYYVAPEVGTIYSEIEFGGAIASTLSILEYNY